jgi:hypothetical protein
MSNLSKHLWSLGLMYSLTTMSNPTVTEPIKEGIVTEPYQDQQSFKYDQLMRNVTFPYGFKNFPKTGNLKNVGSFLQKFKEGHHA